MASTRRPFRYRRVGVVAFGGLADRAPGCVRSMPMFAGLGAGTQPSPGRDLEQRATIARAGDKVLPTDGPTWDQAGQRQNDARPTAIMGPFKGPGADEPAVAL